ncbi:hypothetical protein NDA00_04735 [Funiculus sociatus GB2-M2]
MRELSILLLPVLKTVEGIYRKGQIELVELPQDVSDRTQVLITFLDPGKIDPTKVRQLIDRLETIAGIQQGFVDNLNDLGDEV